MIPSLFMISSAKGTLFLTRLFATDYSLRDYSLLLKVRLLRIFIRQIFLVLLRVVFVFEKIKNKILQNGFFLVEMLYIEKVVQL